jgi:ribosomal-protein-alanine acetyltransferase
MSTIDHASENSKMPPQTLELRLRRLLPQDVERVKEIEMSWPLLSHWNIEIYRRVANGTENAEGFVALGMQLSGEERVVGFLIFRATHPDTEILNVAIDAECARQHVGTRLLHYMETLMVGRGVKNIYLEVRPSNDSARAFYLKEGFTEIGRRKNYYGAPTEDAILMKRELM